MGRLPPADKLPLAVRKNIRDSWESKKGGYEKDLAEILGQPWTIDIDPKSIYPYGEEGSYAKESTGSMIDEYVRNAVSDLRSYVERYGDYGKDEINKAASAHTLTMDIDEAKKVSYCGCAVSPSGQLVIVWEDGNLATNVDSAFHYMKIDKALNDVSSSGICYETRIDIRQNYEAKIGEIQAQINGALKKEYTLEPGFEAAYTKLTGTRANFRENLGSFVYYYFQAFASSLGRFQFDSDDMLQEAFNEEVESKIAFRIVDQSQMKETYGEVVVEGGVLYIQTSPDNYGSNIDDVASKLVDQF